MLSVVQAVQEMTESVLSDGNDTQRLLAGVIERCYGELRRYARRRVGDDAVAEELVQEACLRLVTTGNDLPFNQGPISTAYYRTSLLITIAVECAFRRASSTLAIWMLPMTGRMRSGRSSAGSAWQFSRRRLRNFRRDAGSASFFGASKGCPTPKSPIG